MKVIIGFHIANESFMSKLTALIQTLFLAIALEHRMIIIVYQNKY